MKKQVLALAALAVFGAAAHADDGLTANVSLATKYKYRGQDQSSPEKTFLPAIQGGFDYTLGNLYVGNWNSSIGFAGGTEIDVYGGMKGELSPGLGYDVGVLTYYYPGYQTAAANTTELYGALSYSILSFKYSHTISGKYFGIVDGQNTGYFDLSANYDLMPGLTLNAHVGFTNFSSGGKDNGGKNYFDYKIGVTKDLGKGLSAGAAFVDANKDSYYGDMNKGRVVLSITKAM